MFMKRVGVLIVTYNRLTFLMEEIDSIRKQAFTDFDIIVVNNGSTDGTSEWLKDQEDVICLHQENLGGAGGFYTGLKYITEKNYEFCWLMDDDVECQEDSLSILIRKADDIKDFGFLCSRVFGTENNLMNVPIIETRTENEEYPSWMDKIDEHLIKIKAATFVSVLVPTENVRKVGLPIKEYFLWGDDYEYTTRLSSYRQSYCAFDSKVIHKRKIQKQLNFLTETDRNRILNYYYMIRNTYLNTKKYGTPKDKFVNIVYILYLFVYCVIKMDLFRLKILARAIIGIVKFDERVCFPENY